MVSRCLAALLAATAVLARTPDGFAPSSDTDLVVEYRGFAPLNGVVVSRNVTGPEPRIGTLTRLTGSSYAVMMIDLDIPTDNPPATDTLLHWMQTGLTPATTATQLNTTMGVMSAFLLENSSSTAPVVPYFGPNPPARIPLSHRYTQILVDTSDITEEGMQALQMAAMTLRGFDTESVLSQAGLEGMIVAGNSFNVTNPGPVGAQGTGTGMTPSASNPVPTGAAEGLRSTAAFMGGMALVGMAMLGL
ncbi:CEN-like protein 1 [Madurella mycetomatis]|uniref:CEN-like protein 1 n=1 Tax=Madurella mycetomatis TaxID=100816 RepID=A0A175WFS0_9PEZI|nr:CEN-like protein 1 [Madurella mycetomatis]